MTIRHRNGEYEVRSVGQEELLQDLPPRSVIVTDENVARAVGELPTIPALVLPPGEGNKTLATYGQALEWLAHNGATRKSTLVALGGGVIGDLGGFLAASYMRGIDYLQIPTTLLAQVDSSVGGKVGIDLEAGKNLVGSFHAPVEVRLCTELLRDLPSRQFANGMAEVWKYGAIMDRPLFDRLPVGQRSAELGEVVQRCIQLKAEVVEQDEFETTGLRAILNFGHTIAHAVETLTGYGPVLHGEAVAIGMVVEARLGERLGLTAPGTEAALARCLEEQGLPVDHEVLGQTDSMLEAMRKDKKATDGLLAFSLLTHIGGCKLVQGVDEAVVRSVLKEA